MAHIVITLAVILLSLGLFAWNPVPAAVVAVGASLALYFTGVLTTQELFHGFGDPVVFLIAGLLTIAAGLENAGVGAWAGQFLLRHTGDSQTVRLVAIMVAGAVFSGLIGMNGGVAIMLPVVVVVGVRAAIAPSRLMVPLAFACLQGGKLTLLGTPVNMIAANVAQEAGVGYIGFFEWALLGIPLLLGSIAISILLVDRLLPERHSKSIPADFSAHAQTLVEQYRLEDGLQTLRIRSSSPLVAKARSELDLSGYPDLSLVSVLESDGKAPLKRDRFAEGDLILVRGEALMAGRLAADLDLGIRGRDEAGPASEVLLNRNSGLAEVVIPHRSRMIGQAVFPGMVTEDGGLMVLAVHRGVVELRDAPVALQPGDHVLLQGTWNALDSYLSDTKALVVDSPEVVRKQAVSLGKSAPFALGILLLLIVLLAFNLVPASVAAVLCATLMVVTGVVTLPQVYRGIDWNTPILIGAMIPPATAMTTTGAAHLIGDFLVGALGGLGPLAVLVGIFLVAALISQFVSNTSAALIMMPIGLATATELHVSALPMLMSVAMGASASFLTPFANGVSLMVYGPGGYRFGDFWKLGLVVMAWTLVVTVVVVPIVWRF